jgi:hypothetical protein
MGFEPTTFCMASRTWDPEHPKKVLQNPGFGTGTGPRRLPGFSVKSREFPD